MIPRQVVCALLAASLLTGCADGVGPKQFLGSLGGAAAGGLAGAQFGSGTGSLAMTAAGTLIGAFIGSGIGSSLDKADRMYIGQSQEQAFSAPVGQKITWTNADNGNSGYVQPIRQGYDASGSMCREFQQTIYVGGRAESAYGTACQQPNGAWKLVS